jgi:hypothetical protein
VTSEPYKFLKRPNVVGGGTCPTPFFWWTTCAGRRYYPATRWSGGCLPHRYPLAPVLAGGPSKVGYPVPGRKTGAVAVAPDVAEGTFGEAHRLSL